jgi:quercetin dioxygenase-like cupin family protein
MKLTMQHLQLDEIEEKRLGPGSVVIIPPHAVHSGKSVTRSRVIDVFYPIREDYR